MTRLGREWVEMEMKFFKEIWTTILAVEVKDAGMTDDRVSRYKEKS